MSQRRSSNAVVIATPSHTRTLRSLLFFVLLFTNLQSFRDKQMANCVSVVISGSVSTFYKDWLRLNMSDVHVFEKSCFPNVGQQTILFLDFQGVVLLFPVDRQPNVPLQGFPRNSKLNTQSPNPPPPSPPPPSKIAYQTYVYRCNIHSTLADSLGIAH